MGFRSEYIGHNKDTNIQNLIGDPKKAIIFLAIPAFFSLLAQNLNGIIDGFWVADLGEVGVKATAFFIPFYGSIIAVGNGIGIGAAAVIAKAVSKNDKAHADNVGGQVILVTLIISVIAMLAELLCCGPIIEIMGGGEIMYECMEYIVPIIVGCPVIIISGVIAGMLRGEGDGRRSLIFLASSVLFNLFLDPLFINVMKWGFVGASTAIVVSSLLSICLAYYWYYVKKDTFVKPTFARISENFATQKEIMIICLPQTIELVAMAVFDMFIDSPINAVSGENGVAVFTIMWRVVALLMIPTQAFASALIPVASAAIAQNDMKKLNESITFSFKITLPLMLIATAIIMIFANYAVLAFSWSESTSDMNGQIAYAIRVGCLSIPLIPLTFIGSAILQTIGKGFYAASITIFRNVMFLILFCIGAGNIALYEAMMIWDKMDFFWITYIFNMIFCSLLMYAVARWHYNRFRKKMDDENKTSSSGC